MTSEEIVVRVVEVLESLGVPYAVVGSFATNVYGISRSTKDADFVVELEGRSIGEVTSQLGEGFQLDPQMTFESVTGTTRHVVKVTSACFRVEFFRLSDDPHDHERFARRHRVYVPAIDREAEVIRPEDVVVTKLRWARDASRGKDRDDVRDVISVQAERLDWDYIQRWADEHGTRELLEDIRSTIPPLD